MNHRKQRRLSLLLAAGMILSLAACGQTAPSQGVQVSGENVNVGDLGLRSDGVAGKLYENDGLTLLIPLEYDELLLTELPRNDADGLLFSVSEKASVEADKAQGGSGDGAGWLFGIGRVDREKLQELFCTTDLSGIRPFARDEEGRYYVYYHPTDVRYVRESPEAMKADQEQWTLLCQWAATVCDSIRTENAGLTPVTLGDTDLGLYLGRLAWMPGMRYSVSTTAYGPVEPDSGVFDPAPYLDKLMEGVRYEPVDRDEAPDGEYVALTIPEDKVRFDFFTMEGEENLIRQVTNGYEQFYRAVFEDETITAAGLMQAWYEALVSHRDMGQLGYTPDALVGDWAEKIAGRGLISIRKGSGEDSYDVQINWSGSASEMYVWTMTASPAASNMLRYENGRLSILTFGENGQDAEELQYENGTGTFELLSTNEILWQDETGHAGDDCVFVSAG